MMPIVRIGVLGAAKMAIRRVIPSMQEAKGAVCQGIASSRPGIAKSSAERLGIPLAFDSYDALLASPSIDAVYIPLANGLHRKWVERAAATGKHVLCEKPLALSAADAEEMFAVAERYGVRLMEAYSYRFHPQHQRVCELISQGVVGEKPTFLRAVFAFNLDERDETGRLSTRLDPQAGGPGALMDVGCYGIHTALAIFGSAPVTVTARSVYNKDGVDVGTSGILEFEDGCTAAISAHFGLHFCTEYEVHGPGGRIHLGQAYGNRSPDARYPITISTPSGVQVEELPFTNQITLLLDHFAELVRNPTQQSLIPRADSVTIMRVMDAWRHSALTGQCITL